MTIKPLEYRLAAVAGGALRIEPDMAKHVGVILRDLSLSITEGKGVRGKAVDSASHCFDVSGLAGLKKPPATLRNASTHTTN